MTIDYFKDAPTVGSHNKQVTVEELQATVLHLESRLLDAEERVAKSCEPKPKKTRWKKARKFFTTFVKPVLDFVPKFLNSLANLFKQRKKFA